MTRAAAACSHDQVAWSRDLIARSCRDQVAHSARFRAARAVARPSGGRLARAVQLSVMDLRVKLHSRLLGKSRVAALM